MVLDNVQLGQGIEPLFPPDGRSTVLITTRHEDHPALRAIEPLRLDQFTLAEAMALAERVLGREEARKQEGGCRAPSSEHGLGVQTAGGCSQGQGAVGGGLRIYEEIEDLALIECGSGWRS